MIAVGFLTGISAGMLIGFHQRKKSIESYKESYERSVNIMADKYYKALYDKKLRELSE